MLVCADRLIVLLMAGPGCAAVRCAGCVARMCACWPTPAAGYEVARAHLHVVRRDDDPNGLGEVAPAARGAAGFPGGAAFDTYTLERMTISRAAGGDFVLVNLFRGPVGAPMRRGR